MHGASSAAVVVCHQVPGMKHETDDAVKRRSSGFRQSMVEDVFSYARHNRVEDLERMMDQ